MNCHPSIAWHCCFPARMLFEWEWAVSVFHICSSPEIPWVFLVCWTISHSPLWAQTEVIRRGYLKHLWCSCVTASDPRKVQDLIKLSDHEALIVRVWERFIVDAPKTDRNTYNKISAVSTKVKNKNGEFQYYYGSDEKRPAGLQICKHINLNTASMLLTTWWCNTCQVLHHQVVNNILVYFTLFCIIFNSSVFPRVSQVLELPEGQPRAFFLEPYAEIVKLCWSKGRRRETRNLFIERFDCRAQFMSFDSWLKDLIFEGEKGRGKFFFSNIGEGQNGKASEFQLKLPASKEFNCRTSDNVELILEGTFFWEVVDLPAMVKSTGDTSGDLCNHARSQFIRHVARVTLKEFMDSSHAIAKKVWEAGTHFSCFLSLT